MEITKEKLVAERGQVEITIEQLKANLSANMGALQCINNLLVHLDAPEKAAAPKAD